MKRMEHTIGSRMTGLMRLAGIPLLTALTALAVVSCGSDDAPDTPTPNPPVPPQPKVETPIAFSGSLSEGGSESHARTRATTNPLSATHQTFYAWAYKNPSSGSTETVMKNFTVNYISNSAGSTTTNSRGWEYVNQQPDDNTKPEQSVKYWDFDVTDYRFFGYAGSGVATTYSSSASANPSVSLSFTANAASADLNLSGENPDQVPLYSKLWYKSGTDLATESTQPVQLVFLQPYVKVRFLFKQSESEDYVLMNPCFRPKVTSKIIATAGTFTVTYPLTGTVTEESWSVTPTSSGTEGTDYLTEFVQDYYEADDGETDPDILANQKKWYVVLPAHADSQGSYTLSVKVNGEDKTTVVPAQYMEWRPGYEYTYIFKITDGGTPALYNVLAGFAQWDESVSSYTVYNW